MSFMPRDCMEVKKHRILKSIFIILLALLFGVIYQNISVKRNMNKYKPVGKVFKIGGSNLHIYASGKGSPTIVLIPGEGVPSSYTDFSRIQPELSKLTRVCSYDRAGYGWSDRKINNRSSEQITYELHEILLKSEEKPPFILVGHSRGALDALSYSQKYPEEVVGVVLIDGTNPNIFYNKKEPKLFMYVGNALRNTGIIRILGNIGVLPMINNRQRLIPKEMRNIDKAMIYKNIYNNTTIMEVSALRENAEKISSIGTIGDIPLIIITSAISEKEISGWKESQENLKEWSSKSKQIVVENSGHFIHLEKPEKVIRIIEELLKEVKSSSQNK